jgi:hypothetical protein
MCSQFLLLKHFRVVILYSLSSFLVFSLVVASKLAWIIVHYRVHEHYRFHPPHTSETLETEVIVSNTRIRIVFL